MLKIEGFLKYFCKTTTLLTNLNFNVKSYLEYVLTKGYKVDTI